MTTAPSPAGRERVGLPLRGSVAAACAACAGRLAEAVRSLPGVAAAALDDRANRLQVEFDPAAVSEGDVAAAVRRIADSLADEWEHRTWRVAGMDCASCALSIEKSVNQIPGVRAAVNFSAALLRVEHARGEGEMLSGRVESRVRDLGFSLSPDARGAQALPLPVPVATDGGSCGGHECSCSHADPAPTPRRLSPDTLRVSASGALLALGLVIEHFAAAAPSWLAPSIFAGSVAAGGYRFALSGLRALKARTVGTNLLMALAAVGAAFLGAWEEAAAVVFLYALGEALEGAAMERTRRSLRSLIDAAPAEAELLAEGGTMRTVRADSLVVGDLVLVKPGARLPADGEVVSGGSEVTEAAITGEPLPRPKAPGDAVYAGSVNGPGALTVRVSAAAEDSTLARILQLVEEAQARKAPAQALVERVGAVYTPFVIVAAVLLAVLGPVVAPGPDYLYRALTLLVVACPCALVIATPVAYVTAIARAARSGVLVKGGAVLETLAAARHVAFDKTGTLTEGRPEVVDVVGFGRSEAEVLRVAAAAERASEHPIAAAVLRAALAQGVTNLPSATVVRAVAGRGVVATLAGGEAALVGTPALLESSGVMLTDEHRAAVERITADARTPLLVARGDAVLGAVAVADRPRSEAKAAVESVRALGLAPSMLTGDHAGAADAVAAATGIGEVGAGLLPSDKLRHIEELAARPGGAVFVGDGINDAPALAAASVGVAMGAGGTAAALEAADVALVQSDLSRLPQAVRLARATRGVVRQNVGVALGTVGLLLFGTFAGALPLWVGVLGHEGSALLVIVNALRLLSPALTRIER